MKRHIALLVAGSCLLFCGARLAAGEGDQEAFDLVERAGCVAWPDDFKMDAKVLREKNGQEVFGVNHVFFMAAEEGHAAHVGDAYAIYRAKGHVKGGEDRHDQGILFQGVGVAQVLYVDPETILARVEKQYDGVRTGDGLRLRNTDKKAFASARKKKAVVDAAKASSLKGGITHIAHEHGVAKSGELVYLDLGEESGLVPGDRLKIYRVAPASGDRDGTIGELGEVEIISARKETSAALIIKTMVGLRVGDQVQPMD
jgi:hypothetical protein